MLDSRIDSAVRDLNMKFAEAVEERSDLQEKLENDNLSEDEKKRLRDRIRNLDDEVMKYQEKLRNRI